MFAFAAPENQTVPFAGIKPIPPLMFSDRVWAAFFPIAWIFAHGAVLASVGLALATWIAKPGRAIALSVAFSFLALVGLFIVVETIVLPAWMWVTGQTRGGETIPAIENALISFSPYGGQVVSLAAIQIPYFGRTGLFWFLQGVVLTLTFAFAAGVLGFTVKTLDRALGRVAEGPPGRSEFRTSRDQEEMGAEDPYPARSASSSSPFK